MPEDMILLTRTLDMLRWLLSKAERFPKAQRFILTKRLTDAALDFQEALFDAQAHRGPTRQDKLRDADSHLNKVRLYLRLIHEWGWLTTGQYAHISQMIEEIGRLLGGWIKQNR